MSFASTVLPATVLLPLGIATLMLAASHWLPTRASNVLAILTALTVSILCAYLARVSLDGAVLHWFGGWPPGASHEAGVVLGISFLADPASASVAAFSAFLFAASLTFAWGYFDEEHSHFQILMLLFLAAISGFCLTHDLFNLFVWFELMSVAAFALTAYPLGKSSLEGAFNFTITNTFGSYLMLAGIGLLYARTGTLDFTTMGRLVSGIGSDPVLSGGLCLIAAALLTKAAIVPFHMWLSDAHAVAPTPVSVIFSGIMVSVALFGLAKIIAQIFMQNADAMSLVHSMFLWLGAATALVGGAMAFAQRHLKRLLAFSTIAHLGIMLTGVAALTPAGLGGFLLYLFGHGLVKSTLFMIAGILLAFCNSGDEITLYRKGRQLWPAGIVMAIAGLLLGGLPVGSLHDATDMLSAEPSLVGGCIIVSTSLTGAAVLRAAGRAFPGWSGAPGPEMTAPTEREQEKGDRPLALMLLPGVVLVVLALVPGKLLTPFLDQADARLMHPLQLASSSMPEPGLSLLSFAPIALTLVLLGLSLVRRRPTGRAARKFVALEFLPFRGLQFVHSGLVGDYVIWMVVGLACLSAFIGFDSLVR
jgi:multicomponent Na+:H+ antiporter subunit D